MPSSTQKLVSDMTGAEARKVIVSGVASGVLLAGLVLLLINFAVGAVIGALMKGGL